MFSKIFLALSAMIALPVLAAPPTAVLGMTPPAHSFGNQNVGTVAAQLVTVKNTGTKIATAVSVSGAGAPFSIAGSTCGPNLGIGATCNFAVKFAPTAAGTFTDSLNLKYHNGTTLVTVAWATSGKGIALPPPPPPITPAFLTISNAPSFNYGAHDVGAATDHAFTVSNTGGQIATVFVPSIGAPYSIVSNGCGAFILKGASCGVTVRFKPVAVGLANGNLHLSYHNGVAAAVSTRAVSGIGKLPPPPPPSVAVFTLLGPGLVHFGARAVGSSTPHIFTLKNIGAGLGKLVSVNIGAPFLVTGNTCGVNVAPGAQCKLTVNFAPVSAGLFSNALKVTYFNGIVNKLVAVNVDGSGVGPSSLGYLGGAFFNYGTVKIGSFAQTTFVLKNSGTGPASGLTFNSTAPFFIVGKTCGTTLAAGAACNITVRFAPAMVGFASAAVQATYVDIGGGKSLLLKLKGFGQALANLGFTAGPTFDFGSIPAGTSRGLLIGLKNFGGGAANLGSLSLGAPFFVSASSCGAFLPPGFSCQLSVVFAPPVAGPASTTLTANYFDGAVSRTATIGLIGFALDPATLLISDAPVFDFGTVSAGSASAHGITVTNVGQVAAAITSATIASPFDVMSGGCAGFLPAGASCSLTLRFQPTAGGTFADTLTVAYKDGVNPRITTRVVRGTGSTPARLAFAEGTSVDFGAVAVGASASRSLTLLNIGSSAASAMQAPKVNAPYSIAETDCGAALGVGEKCSVTVDFAPMAAGAFPDALTLTYSDGLNIRTLSLTLTGSGGANVGFDGATLALARVDGGLYVGGDFTTYRGLPAARLVKLQENGAIDGTFNVGTGFDAAVRAVATIPGTTDIYVGGAFTTYNGNAVGRFVRLRADGALAAKLDFDNDVRAIAVDSTGRAYVGGDALVRLTPDAAIDTTFNAVSDLNGRVNALLVEGDGRVAVGGAFNKFVDDSGETHGYNRFVRLASDGSVASQGNGFDAEVYALATDGTYLYVGGDITGYQGQDVRGVAKLDADGSLASYALPSTFTGRVSAIALGAGNVTIGGSFGNGNLLRTDAAGVVDASFAVGAGAEDSVSALLPVSDGTLAVAGRFTTYDAAAVNRYVVVDAFGKKVLP